jgi:hypothetical protein
MKRKDHEFFGGYELESNFNRIEWFIPSNFDLDRDRELSMANEGGTSAALLEGPDYHGHIPFDFNTTGDFTESSLSIRDFIGKPAVWVTSTGVAAGIGYYFYKYHKSDS